MKRAAFVVSVLLLAGACTKATLERWPPDRAAGRDDKLAVSGRLCTREPESLVFPLRVLFVVDGSESMEITDPPDPVTGETGRERAVRDTWESLLAQGSEGVRVGIIRFSAQAQSRTPVLDSSGLPHSFFTADATQLDAATRALGVTDRTTNYVNALSEAFFEVRTELMEADQESLPLSKYVVIFLSDGLPDVDQTESRAGAIGNILDSVAQLKDLARLFHVGDFSFHTAYLSSGQGPVMDRPAQDLLQQMADVGGGTYRSFPSGESLNFVHIDLSVIRRVFTLRTLAAVRTNVLMDTHQIPLRPVDAIDRPGFVDLDGDHAMSCGEPLVDSDGDGLSDVIERRIGSDPLVRDTDDDGLGDRVEWDFRMSGLDPLDPGDAGCFVPDPCVDDDGDGACDCVRDSDLDGVCNCASDPDTPCADAAGHDCLDADADGWCDCPDLDGDGRCDWRDKDGDGLRDCEEIYFGTSHNGSDSDADGIPDLLEVRYRTSPAKIDDLADLDWDMVPNGTEVLGGTDALCDDSGFRSFVAQRYSVQDEGLTGASTCYDFDVDNILLVPTLENPDAERPGNGWNRVLFYAGEVAFDDPETFAAWRVACVEASYDAATDFKNPPSGRMTLTDEDFVDVHAFDPETNCIRP